ncbi:MAG: response regulator [Bacteriovoracaceae bacterium]|jgi:response regulator RpfG family c-di-GMP phosphodiesterase|nr:response regulator [Bacteriovoracaceae bacterium]
MIDIVHLDDSKFILKAYRGRLSQYGYNCHCVLTVEECFEKLQSVDAKCVLIDYEMPEMEGPDVARMLKLDKRFRNIPILILTSSEKRESLLKAIYSGADDFINKEIDIEILACKINASIRHTELLEKAAELERFVTANAMVTTYCHEIRNPLTIALCMLGQKHENFLPAKYKSTKDALIRISEVLKRLEKISTVEINFESYDEDLQMVSIKK